MRPALLEPALCSPSTSYVCANVAPLCRRSLAGRQGLARNARLDLLRCNSAQAISYHNTYKLLHQPSRHAKHSQVAHGPEEQPQAGVAQPAGEQLQQARPRRKRGPRASPAQGSDPPSEEEPTLAEVSEAATALSLETKQYQPPPQFAKASRKPARTLATTQLDLLSPTTPASQPSAAAAAPAARPGSRPARPSLSLWEPPTSSLTHRTALTHAITTCPSYTRLHQLLLGNAADYNVYHTCATLHRFLQLHAQGLSPREARLFKEGCATLQGVLRRLLPELHPRACVVAAHALARLELPDRELLAGLAAAVEPQLHVMEAQGLSSLLWSFAQQGHQPPPRWMEAYLTCCMRDLHAFKPQHVATLLWALARLHYKVAPARLQDLLAHAQANLHRFNGRSLSNTVYALALSQQQPGREWLAEAQQQAVRLGPGAFTPQGLTQLLWGLSRLGATPSPALRGLLAAHVRHRLLPPRGGARVRFKVLPYNNMDLATMLYVLGTWRLCPRRELSGPMLEAVRANLKTMDPNHMCNCLWACARLRIRPHDEWLADFLSASYGHVPYFKPVDLAQSLWAMARLRVRPPAAWLSAALTRLEHCASMFSAVDVSNTMWALASLGVQGEALPAEVLALFFVATDRRLSSFKDKDLSSMIWALARMRRRPDKEWAAEFLKVTYHKLPSMSGWCLGTLIWALAELSLVPPPAWIYHYVNAARSLMAGAPPQPADGAAAQEQGEEEAAQPLEAGVAAAGGGKKAAAGRGGARRAAKQGGAPGLPELAYLAHPAGGGAAGAGAVAGEGAVAGVGYVGGLSALDLGQIITSLRRLNVRQQLGKVDDFVAEAEAALRGLEERSGAYASTQVGMFLSLRRGPRAAAEAGGAAGDGEPAAPHAQPQPQPHAAAGVHLNGSGGGHGADGLNGVALEAGQRHPGGQQAGADGGALQADVEADLVELRRQLDALADSVAAQGAAGGGGSGAQEVSRVLRSGTRLTLQMPREVRLEVGDLMVELGGHAAGGGVSVQAGEGQQAGGGEGLDASGVAERDRRLAAASS